MGEILALAFMTMIVVMIVVGAFLKIESNSPYRKVDRKKAPLFAVTFHCPVCGDVMKFEHESCEAKYQFLKDHTERLTKDIKDLKAGKTW